MKLQGVDRTILMQSSNIDLGDVLPDYARTCILRMAGKYFGRLNTDIYAAFRLALERVAKQLRRAKRELREDKAKRVDKHLDWLGSTRSRRRLERGAPGMPVRTNHGSAYRVAAE